MIELLLGVQNVADSVSFPGVGEDPVAHHREILEVKYQRGRAFVFSFFLRLTSSVIRVGEVDRQDDRSSDL